MTSSLVIKPGTYFLGDPCYSVPDEDWHDWLIAADYEAVYARGGNVLDGVIKGHRVIGLCTAYGDGTYPSSKGGWSFPVDAGLIGLVPKEYGSKASSSPDGFVYEVRFDHPTSVTREDDGTLHFGHITIWTGDDPEDEYYEEDES